MMGNIGPLEIGIVLIIALIVFGPKRLPELGSSLGKGIHGFGNGIKGEGEAEPEEAGELGEASSAPAPGTEVK
jgi:sec-independent protein translocase protein TatA